MIMLSALSMPMVPARTAALEILTAVSTRRADLPTSLALARTTLPDERDQALAVRMQEAEVARTAEPFGQHMLQHQPQKVRAGITGRHALRNG